MATVWVPALLRPLCGGASRVEVDGATLGAVLEAVDRQFPGFLGRVVEGGRVRPELAIAIRGEVASYALHEPVPPGAEVSIVPAVGGG